MENTPLNNAVIEITEEAGRSKGQYGMILKIKGKDVQTGKTNTYTIYDKTSKGEVSKAWEAYDNGALIGQTVQVGYATKEGTLQDGSPFTQRIIRTINRDIGEGVKNAQAMGISKQVQSPHSEANFNSGSTVDNAPDKYWDKKAYKQCLWNFWLEKDLIVEEDPQWKDTVWKIFKEIETDADKRFATGWDKAKTIFEDGSGRSPLPEELPTIQVEEINVEDIPF